MATTDRTGSTAGEPTAKRTMRHVARFILLAYYTASRPGATLTASWRAAAGRSWLDLDNGVFYRLREGARATNKRQPPVRIPACLLAHLRRWKRLGGSYAIEYHGQPVASVKVAFGRASIAAGLGKGVSPHTLRHTACTLMAQRGAPDFEACGYAGMSPATYRRTYAHHHPDHMRAAIAAIAGGRAETGQRRRNGTRIQHARPTRTALQSRNFQQRRTVMSGRP